MAAALALRNVSRRKLVVRRSALERLANRVCSGENVGGEAEVSVLFCDDDEITALNRRYRRMNSPTDVLSFEQDCRETGGTTSVLGDIVISLETAERNCSGDRALMRREVELLFCHGLLHLLGYNHRNRAERAQMLRKQAEYLGTTEAEAWRFGPKDPAVRPMKIGGSRPLGRAK